MKAIVSTPGLQAPLSRRRAVLFTAALCASLAFELACNPQASTPGGVTPSTPLAITAQAVQDIAQSVNTITTAVIAANGQKPPLISDADTSAILGVLDTVAKANMQASALIRNLSSLSTAQQGNVWAVLQPVVATVNTSLQSGLLGIKDPATKQKVQLALTTLQAALAAVQVALGGSS